MAYVPRAGEVVRVREWDDMVAEFGLDEDGNIPCRCNFVRKMKCFCGTEFKVGFVDEERGRLTVSAEERSGIHNWCISVDMIEPVYAEPPVEVQLSLDVEELF